MRGSEWVNNRLLTIPVWTFLVAMEMPVDLSRAVISVIATQPVPGFEGSKEGAVLSSDLV